MATLAGLEPMTSAVNAPIRTLCVEGPPLRGVPAGQMSIASATA